MRVIALYGTESGNAEEVARAIAKDLRPRAVDVLDMAEATPDLFVPGPLFLITCATHGGGELPGFAQFLHDDLSDLSPDLTGVRYAMFGLGDTSYDERYLRGAKQFDGLLERLGAQRVGPFGEHDVMTKQRPGEVGVAWAHEVLAGLDS